MRSARVIIPCYLQCFFRLIHLTYTSQPRALAIEVEPLKGIVLNLVILLFQDWVELFSYISATMIKIRKYHILNQHHSPKYSPIQPCHALYCLNLMT